MGNCCKGKNVSVELITDSKVAEKEIGLSFYENSLYSSINLEAPKDRTPILVKTSEGRYCLVFKNVETGNYLPGGRAYDIVKEKDVELASYASYFTMGSSEEEPDIAADEPTALYNLLPVDRITVNGDMPVARYLRYKEKFEIDVKAYQEDNGRLYAYNVDKEWVANVFNTVPEEDIAVAEKIVNELLSMDKEDKKTLKGYMRPEKENQFDVLDDLMKGKGIKYILADTRLTVHMFTALPWEEIDEGNALVLYDGDQITFLTTKTMDKQHLKLINRFDSLKDAVESFTEQETIGFEGMSLEIRHAFDIGLDRLVDVTSLIGLWRDRMAYQELAYYIVTIQANLYAMENALAFAGKALRNGTDITERDVETKFMSLLEDFKHKYGCGNFDFGKYFVVLHAGARCLYPALSSGYKLNTEMNTLKLDAGVFLFKNGILRSSTDLCRCLVLTDKGKEVYEILQKNIREDVIDNIKAGMTGEDVYWLGVRPLSKFEQRFKEMDMLDGNFSIENGYSRDNGHTISKEESRTVSCEKGDKGQVWEEFMLGCIEYQWPYIDHAIGIEDMFLVTPEKTLNLTI